MLKYIFSFATLFSFFTVSAASNPPDSLILSNGDVILGEIESLDKSILSFSTDYSDDDFTIKWEEVQEIYSNRYFIIVLDQGDRLQGKISTSSPRKAVFILKDSLRLEKDFEHIVYIDKINKSGGRWEASIDVGYTYTKISNIQQFSLSSSLAYYSQKWLTNFNSNIISSKQKNTNPYLRIDGKINFLRFLGQGWLTLTSIDILKNEKQNLNLRTTTKLGIGNFIKRNNKMYFATAAGLAWNNENFITQEHANKNSMEGFLGLELNAYNMGDLDILTAATTYPSFTEKGRWRTDYKLSVKYDLPFDFYVKLSYTLNFDNQPTGVSEKLDYVLETSFGWEL